MICAETGVIADKPTIIGPHPPIAATPSRRLVSTPGPAPTIPIAWSSSERWADTRHRGEFRLAY